jgi:hypothetical protein
MAIKQIEGIIGDPSSWKVHEETGELVEVLVPNGRGAKMKLHKSEAIRLGLWTEPEADADAEQKAQRPKPNKQRRPGANKGANVSIR